MTNTHVPGDENPQQENLSNEEINGKPFYIRPQFEIIDDSAQTRFHEEEAKSAGAQKGLLSLRFICFLGFVFCLIFGLGMFLMSLVTIIIAACSLFRNPILNESIFSFWKLFFHSAISSLGFILGVISPTVGLGLIALYFTAKREIGNSLLYTIIKRSFNKF